MKVFKFWGCANSPWDSPHKNFLVQENTGGPWIVDGCGIEHGKKFSSAEEALRYYRDLEAELLRHPREDLEDPGAGIFPELRGITAEEYRKNN